MANSTWHKHVDYQISEAKIKHLYNPRWITSKNIHGPVQACMGIMRWVVQGLTGGEPEC